jgi:hypothetical protein
VVEWNERGALWNPQDNSVKGISLSVASDDS